MYKIETHFHTTYVSHCGWLGAPALVKTYAAAGYDAIVVTDHYNRDTFPYIGVDLSAPGDKTPAFLEGVRRMRYDAEKYGILIYEGAELRFDESPNDFLLFGFPHELLADPEAVMRMGVAQFSQKCREAGAVLIQAHPFRNKCTIAPAHLIDGVEIVNPNPRHDSRDALARAFGEEHGLIMTGGSDCHRPGDECASGILSETLPKDSFAFAELLRSKRFSVIDPVAAPAD